MGTLDKDIAARATGAGLIIADIVAAGGIHPRWQPFSEALSFLVFEPDARERPEAATSNMRVVPVALAAQPGSMKLHLCQKPQMSSVFAPNREFLDRFPDAGRYDVTGDDTLEAVTLDGWCAAENTRPDFIKIDTEGSEAETLTGAAAVLPAVLGVEAEIAFQQIRNGQPLAEDVIALLREQGFELVDFLRLYRWGRRRHSLFGQVALGDALFMRSPESVAKSLGTMAAEDAAATARKYLVLCAAYRLSDFFIAGVGLFSAHLSDSAKQHAARIAAALQRRASRLETILRMAWRITARFGQMPLPFWNR